MDGSKNQMRIEAICVGKPEKHIWNEKEYNTSFFKKVVQGPVRVLKDGLAGDEAADKRFHRKPASAVYAMGKNLYQVWEKALDLHPQPAGAFGENLTLTNLIDKDYFAGDIFRIGSVIIEATGPRIPCPKLNLRFRNEKALSFFRELKNPGIYFSVKQEGEINVGDELKLDSRQKNLVPVLEIFDIIALKKKPSPGRLQELKNFDFLEIDIRNYFSKLGS